MGLIKAATSAIKGTLSNQFLTLIKCEDMDNNILMKKVTTEDGIIAKKSAIIVAPGQVAVIYDNGNILDATAEAGSYTFDKSSTPSFFGGDFGDVFKEMWTRFKFGGAVNKEQAVFFINIKEILDNKFGTPNPVPYKDWGHPLLNPRTNTYLPMSVEVKCFGKYTFKITDPALFMSELAGTKEIYTKSELEEQIRAEVIYAFSNILNSLGEEEHKIDVLSLPNKTDEIKAIMDEEEFDKNIRARGVSLKSFAIESVTLDEDSKHKIDTYELGGDAYQQKGTLTESYSEAVKNASENKSGFAEGFMGIGVMNMATGNLFGGVAQSAMPNTNQQTGTETPNTWKCTCGAVNTSKFCSECGSPKDKKCSKCGIINSNEAKFCKECGEKL